MLLLREKAAVSKWKRKKRKEKITLFSDHNGSLLRRQPGARQQMDIKCPSNT